MSKLLKNKNFILFFLIFFTLSSCAKEGFFKTGDARKNPPDPELRVKKNLEEGKGFRLSNSMGFGGNKGTNFEFATSNGVWRASLDVIDFMPLSSVNYSGGVIISDWYSSEQASNESIKVSIRFLTNEIRSDALDIKIFNRQCTNNFMNCNISEISGNLVTELKKEIIKKAAIYKKQKEEKGKG